MRSVCLPFPYTKRNINKVLAEKLDEESLCLSFISDQNINEQLMRLGVTTVHRLHQLKYLIKNKEIVLILEAHNALSALITEHTVVERNGKKINFDGIWSSSLTDSTAKGKPDIETVDMTSRINGVNEIFEVTTKPMLFDADTGGKTEHFAFTVRSLERTGVSAVIIEDKTGLKKNQLKWIIMSIFVEKYALTLS